MCHQPTFALQISKATGHLSHSEQYQGSHPILHVCFLCLLACLSAVYLGCLLRCWPRSHDGSFLCPSSRQRREASNRRLVPPTPVLSTVYHVDVCPSDLGPAGAAAGAASQSVSADHMKSKSRSVTNLPNLESRNWGLLLLTFAFVEMLS